MISLSKTSQLYLVLSLPLADTLLTVQTVAEDIHLADDR